MITPHRLMNLDYCLLNVSRIVFEIVLERGAVKLDRMQKALVAELPDLDTQSLMLSVSFLFLIGAVDYDKYDDAVVLRGRSND